MRVGQLERIIKMQTKVIEELRSKLRAARDRIRRDTYDCCENENRNMDGGCDNCGDPCPMKPQREGAET